MGEQRGLIQHGGAHDQPLLFSDLPERVMEHVESLERAGEWTGERLFSQNRQIYEAIVRMVAADFPDVTIAQLLKVSTNTVAGVRQREGESIEDQKKRMIPLMQRTKERLLQRIYETAPSLPGDRAAVAFGIVSDKLALESGAPTQRIEISTVPAVDDYRRWMESHVLDGCVQVAQTGCEGGVCGTKGAEAVVVSGVGEGGLDGGSAVAGDGRADRQSVVLQGESGDATGDATAADGGAGEVGGAGVDARDGGGGGMRLGSRSRNLDKGGSRAVSDLQCFPPMKNEPEKKEGELIPESDCARNLGLELKVLEEVRERVLVPEDYVLTPDGAQYRPHAVRKVLAALEAPEELAGECAKKEGPVTLYVSRKFRNSRILEATPDRLHHEPACLVRVPDSGRFSLGAALEAVSVEGEIWRLHGRAPRRLVKPAAIPAAVAKKEEGAL